MTRTVVAVILGVACGTVAAGVVLNRQYGDQLAAAEAAHRTLQEEFEQLKRARPDQALEAAVEELKSENRSLYEELHGLQLALAEANQRLEAVPEAEWSFEPFEQSMPGDAAVADGRAGPRDGSGQQEGEGRRGPGGAWQNMTEEERAQRIQEFTQRARERAYETLMAEFERVSDPEAKQRITSISEYNDYMIDLRMQMRTAQTDEEREQLRSAMAETQRAVGQLTREHQEYLLRELAANSGITDPAAQDNFLRQLRETQRNPLLRGAPTMGAAGGAWGGRGGVGGGGAGGGGGRGGG